MSSGLVLPAAPGGVSDEMAAFAAGLIDRTGQAPVIEAALARPTGRRRPLPVRAVLTALLCLALEDRPLFLTEVTRAAVLPAAARVPAGCPACPAPPPPIGPSRTPTAGSGTASTRSAR